MRTPHPLVIILLLVSLPALVITASGSEAKKPNVIFILTDDQGWGDAHFAGHPYVKTPNLDKFASQSKWLRQFYCASPVCSPSRAAFLTGHFPARDQVHGHFAEHKDNAERAMPDWLDPEVPTVASLLRRAGYATAHFGKWHLGGGRSAPSPNAYGFDVTKTETSSNGPTFAEEKDEYWRAKSTAIIVDETIKFIRDHKDGPFYVDLWTLLPHAPLKPTPEQLKPYEDLDPKADDPAFGPWMQKYLSEAKDLKSQMQVYCASLTDLDTQLGRLFSALKEMKLENDTIIFLASDNGSEDYSIFNATNAGVGNNGPLRARKRSIYEGGIRTFGLIRWPGKVVPGVRDEESVVGAVDFLPTICRLTGTDLPATVTIDGEDVSDIWLDKSRPRTKPLFWEWVYNVTGGKKYGYMPSMVSVRDGDWKLFVNHDGSGVELFDVRKDIGEQHNVAAQNPDIVKDLTNHALTWVKSLPQNDARNAATATGEAQDSKEAREKRASGG